MRAEEEEEKCCSDRFGWLHTHTVKSITAISRQHVATQGSDIIKSSLQNYSSETASQVWLQPESDSKPSELWSHLPPLCTPLGLSSCCSWTTYSEYWGSMIITAGWWWVVSWEMDTRNNRGQTWGAAATRNMDETLDLYFAPKDVQLGNDSAILHTVSWKSFVTDAVWTIKPVRHTTYSPVGSNQERKNTSKDCVYFSDCSPNLKCFYFLQNRGKIIRPLNFSQLIDKHPSLGVPKQN